MTRANFLLRVHYGDLSQNARTTYSDDLRWRMTYQRLFYRRSYEEIASQLFVCRRTVNRTYRKFLSTGDVKSCRLGRPAGSITLFPHEEYIIMDCLLCTRLIQLHEIANHISNATGSAFGPETLCRAIYRLGITRKKVIAIIINTRICAVINFIFNDTLNICNY